MTTKEKTKQPHLPGTRNRIAKERTSIFLESGSLSTAMQIAAAQSQSSPNRDRVTQASVIREALSIGLGQLAKTHL